MSRKKYKWVLGTKLRGMSGTCAWYNARVFDSAVIRQIINFVTFVTASTLPILVGGAIVVSRREIMISWKRV